MTSPVSINDLPDLFAPDLARIALAKERQARFWRGEPNAVAPIICSGALRPEQERIPDPDFKQAFEDLDLMIFSQVRQACAMANGRSDAVPSVRGNYGTGVLLSCLGLEQDVFPDKMPWLRQHLTREQVAALEPDDIQVRGTFARGLEFMQKVRDLFGDRLPVYCMDTQGPFDLAHLIIGDDLFFLLHDDPPLAAHLMDIAVELGMRTHAWMKTINGEAANTFTHSNSIYAENIGLRICEDTSAIVGPELIETVCLPASRRLAAHFGQAWTHYCGRNDHLTAAICAAPELIGLNFGHIPGHEQDHPFDADMARCRDSGTRYVGNWPLLPGESGTDYLQRLHAWAAEGVLLPQMWGTAGFESTEAMLDAWYDLSNEKP